MTARNNHGGARRGAGRPPAPARKVKRTITLSPSVLEWVQGQRREGEDFSNAIERLLNERQNTMATITGPVTQTKLQAWIDTNRPELGIDENHANEIKGFYRLDLGPAASLVSCGQTWRDVAAALGAIEISE
jgi:predicted CopG family antitoxin